MDAFGYLVSDFAQRWDLLVEQKLDVVQGSHARGTSAVGLLRIFHRDDCACVSSLLVTLARKSMSPQTLDWLGAPLPTELMPRN